MITVNIQNIDNRHMLGLYTIRKKSLSQSKCTLSIGHRHSHSGGVLAAYFPTFEQQEDRNPRGTQCHRTVLSQSDQERLLFRIGINV